MSVNYVAVFYMGSRRSAGPACHVADHLDYLQENNCKIDKVTLVLNAESKEQIAEFSKLVQGYKPYYTELHVLIRQNMDFSYGGWNDAVTRSVKNGEIYDYFLTEDDYIPNMQNFLDPFYEQMTDRTAYVCCKVLEGHGQPHAAHSVGLLNGEAASLMVKRNGSAINIAPAHNYPGVEWNQVHFLDELTGRKYLLKEISGDYSVPFSDLSNNFIELSNPKGLAPIVPVGYNG